MEFTLQTKTVRIKNEFGELETGSFDLSYMVSPTELEQSRSPKDYLWRKIATQLQGAIEVTGVPLELWKVNFDPQLQREFNLPATVPFS